MSNVVDITLFLTTFLTLFVIMDPPGILPVYMGLTSTMTPKQRRNAAWQATLTSLGVVLAFTLFGQYIFGFLHISVPALQSSGGLLLLLVAMQLLTGDSMQPKGDEQVNIALVPLGTPLLAGPGTIVASMLAIESAGHEVPGWVAVLSAIVILHLIIWLTMRYSGFLSRLLGPGGITLLTRIAGVLLAAIAVQLIADGVRGFITM